MGKVIALALLLAGCAHTPAPTPSLPHRPHTGNHGQGESPPADCPGQYKEIVPLDEDGNNVMVYCWGRKVST